MVDPVLASDGHAYERVAIERGCCKLTLEVLSENHAAKKAYARYGFGPYELDPKAGQAHFWQKALQGKAGGEPGGVTPIS